MTTRRFVATGLAIAIAALVFASSTLAAGKPAPTGKINLNTATVEQLTTLPGVGPQLAARIVEYRTKSGAFRATQDVMNVKGIGEKNYAKLEQWLTVGEPAKGGAK